MPLLRRRPPAPPRPPADRACTATTRTGRACTQWTRPGTDTCAAHTPRPRRPPGEQSNTRGLVAASWTVRFEGAAWRDWKPGNREWQADAWRLYDITGQLRFVARSVASAMSRCKLYVAELDEAGNEIGEAKDTQIAALAAVPLGIARRAENIQLLSLCLFVAGEGYIVAESEADTEGGDLWYVVSGAAVKRQGNLVTVKRPRQYGGGEFALRAEDSIIQVWTPHPNNDDEPDSPTRSAIPPLRELELIRKREFAELESRLLGGGVWFLPESIDFPRKDDDPEWDFVDELIETAGISISDQASAKAKVPITVTVPDELVDKIQPPTTFWSELSEQLLPMKEAALRDLAQSLDAPPEVMTGLSETNHWSAWLIDEDTIKTHYEPPLQRIAEAMTSGYLWGALKALGKDPARYAYRFSTAPLRVRSDRTADAIQLHGLGLLSDEETVEAANWQREAMPAKEERLRRLAEKALDAAPQVVLMDPELRALVGFQQPPPVLPEAEAGPIQVESEVTPPGPPEPRALPEQPAGPPEAGEAALVAGCELVVLRALELAGGRLVPHRERGDTPKHLLHTRVAAADTATAERALAGAWAHLGIVAAAHRMDAGQLERLLHGYTVELLTRGRAHDAGLLGTLLAAARAGAR